MHYLGEGETCELDTKGRVLLVAHSFSVLLCMLLISVRASAYVNNSPIGNLAIYATRHNRGFSTDT